MSFSRYRALELLDLGVKITHPLMRTGAFVMKDGNCLSGYNITYEEVCELFFGSVEGKEGWETFTEQVTVSEDDVLRALNHQPITRSLEFDRSKFFKDLGFVF